MFNTTDCLSRKSFVLALLCAAALPLAAPLAVAATANQDKIIISGASGQLGDLTVKELLKRGVPAKNLILVSRTPEKLAEYAKLGASTRFGDVDKPESLPAAYAGGTRMLMISLGAAPGSPPRPPRHKLAFDAAAKAGVKHIVYTSFLGAEKEGAGLAADHHESEKYLMASGAAWTSLRNGIYIDMQLRAAEQMASSGRATVRPNETKSAPVTREDCAAAAAGALLGGSKFENQAFDITGPELVDTRDIAKIVGDIIGKPIAVVEQAAAGAGPGGGLMSGLPSVVSDAVMKLSGRPATSMRTLLQANKAQLIAAANKS